MITQTVTVKEKEVPNIIIGRRGEYEAEQIVFDVSYLISTYGDGVAVLMVKRPMDKTAYPAETTKDGSTVTWIVTETDTSYKGHGECELFWYVGNALAKSVIYSTSILRDIGITTEEPPDPYQTWIDSLTELGAETLANAQSAAESADAADQSEKNAKDSEVNAKASEESAAQSEASARVDSLKAEGFAVGEQDGAAVARGSPYYQNNAKFYSEVAQQGAIASGFAWFDVNDEDGQMYVTITPSLAEDVSFHVNEELGVLEVIVNG